MALLSRTIANLRPRWGSAGGGTARNETARRSGPLDGVSARSQRPDLPSLPTKAMRSMLVEPGVPKGTPAVMMIRWPGLANSS